MTTVGWNSDDYPQRREWRPMMTRSARRDPFLERRGPFLEPTMIPIWHSIGLSSLMAISVRSNRLESFAVEISA